MWHKNYIGHIGVLGLLVRLLTLIDHKLVKMLNTTYLNLSSSQDNTHIQKTKLQMSKN